MSELRQWQPWEVVWGGTLCEACRVRPAEVLLDEIPLCVDAGCADDLLERIFAVDIQPSSVHELPPVFERLEPKRRPPARLPDYR